VNFDLHSDPVELALALVNIESVSGNEAELANALAAALGSCAHLEILRDGAAIVARTNLGSDRRVIVAGHLDTVPVRGNLPGWHNPASDELWGRGSVDMKGGLAVMAHLAAELDTPRVDVSWVFYDQEEVASDLSGLGRLIEHHPDWIKGDFAVLAEPTSGGIEVGCNGTLRVIARFAGKAAHSARAWMGVNAIHAAAPTLATLAAHTPTTVSIDGFDYPESLNAVFIEGGIAGNVIPDQCALTVNYRFAPDKTAAQALRILGELLGDIPLDVDDVAPPARPDLLAPEALAFLMAAMAEGSPPPQPKVGWTDVARFAEMGIPAVNCGPGDPTLAHTDDERCPAEQIRQVAAIVRRWLT